MDSDERKGEVKGSFREDELAPVVLFTYNRLEHTKKTVEALQQNVLAAETKLFIYSDAPKNEAAQESVAAVREYLHGITGFKRVEIIERQENWGLARNIIDGVTKIVNEYGKIIVLEDDILTSRYFLQFMNDALRIYEKESKVMAISGYCWAKDKADLSETFFLRWFSCWGWATWKDAWGKFERNPEKLVREHNLKDNIAFNINGTENLWSQVEQNLTGEIFTWAIFFDVIIWINEGLVLYSNEDLCVNIGFDGSGEHCGEDDGSYTDHFLRTLPVKDYSNVLLVSDSAEKLVENFFIQCKSKHRIDKRVRRVWKKEGMQGVFKKVFHKLFNL